MSKNILLRPIISEKSELLSNGLNKYSFVVASGANKIEIKDAVERMYPEVKVANVNTIVTAAKAKTRNTRSGVQRGRVASYKKAIVTLEEGSVIDFFGEL